MPLFAIQMLQRLRDDPTHGRMCKVKALREVAGNVVEEEDKVALVFPGRGGAIPTISTGHSVLPMARCTRT
ncbi:hypothetical protein [Nocardia gipuzkoensis]|uniref:hypothetical protein n=1 Tax=Nocardia gipuzkoensis TaxID=2749991 RepID=UPI00237E578A|nr:hypothetical protein [Nocardia gipuzkoensis]MDE1674865.1 hypothetical protein [Nocardia gipuzkoensis]